MKRNLVSAFYQIDKNTIRITKFQPVKQSLIKRAECFLFRRQGKQLNEKTLSYFLSNKLKKSPCWQPSLIGPTLSAVSTLRTYDSLTMASLCWNFLRTPCVMSTRVATRCDNYPEHTSSSQKVHTKRCPLQLKCQMSPDFQFSVTRHASSRPYQRRKHTPECDIWRLSGGSTQKRLALVIHRNSRFPRSGLFHMINR